MPGTGGGSGPRWPSADHDSDATPDNSTSSTQQTTDQLRIPANASGNPQQHPTVRVPVPSTQPVEGREEGWPPSQAEDRECSSSQVEAHAWPSAEVAEAGDAGSPPRFSASAQSSPERSPAQSTQSPPPSQQATQRIAHQVQPQPVHSQPRFRPEPQAGPVPPTVPRPPAPQPEGGIPAAGRQACATDNSTSTCRYNRS